MCLTNKLFKLISFWWLKNIKLIGQPMFFIHGMHMRIASERMVVITSPPWSMVVITCSTTPRCNSISIITQKPKVLSLFKIIMNHAFDRFSRNESCHFPYNPLNLWVITITIFICKSKHHYRKGCFLPHCGWTGLDFPTLNSSPNWCFYYGS
jgi:hypothetical protein